MTVSYQDRHHLQQEVASGAGLADLPTSSPRPQPPTEAPCPPGTGPHLPRTGSGSGSSWRRYRRKCWGPKVCRRPESVLEKGRLSVAPPGKATLQRSAAEVHTAQEVRPLSGALLADLQNPRKRALPLPQDIADIHDTSTARDGVRGLRRGIGLRKELWRETHWGREGSPSPDQAALSRLCTGEPPGFGGD